MNKAHGSRKAKKDVIVSVRLPQSLSIELKDLAKINHFMDLSDEIRFIVRRYCLKFLHQDKSQQPSIDIMAEQRRKEKLIEELSRIIDSLKNNPNAGKGNTANQEHNNIAK